jgi:hypothetical protein
VSANLVVDLANTTDYRVSVSLGSGGGGPLVGEIIDMEFANTLTNIFCAGGPGSGAINLQVQTCDGTASGSFTDPTSGLSAGAAPGGLPVGQTNLVSGGNFWVNSGLWTSGNFSVTAPVNNAPVFCSGGIQFGAFQMPHRFARLISLSGAFPNFYNAGFIKQKRTVGSGAGFTWSPGSGASNFPQV